MAERLRMTKEKREYPDRPYVGVGVIVFRDQEVLLVKREKEPNKGQWSIPGGRQIIGETTAEAAQRELLEETGVKVDRLLMVDVVDVIIPDIEGKIKYHYTLVEYMGQWQSGESRPGDDAQEVKWVRLTELISYSLLEKTKNIIQKAAAMNT
ncbi:NUDIX hydrolase [Deltaproteobacteria bacterium]|nr:NUDIX hydrolase [Deltaproteobacteria bacterium]